MGPVDREAPVLDGGDEDLVDMPMDPGPAADLLEGSPVDRHRPAPDGSTSALWFAGHPADGSVLRLEVDELGALSDQGRVAVVSGHHEVGEVLGSVVVVVVHLGDEIARRPGGGEVEDVTEEHIRSHPEHRDRNPLHGGLVDRAETVAVEGEHHVERAMLLDRHLPQGVADELGPVRREDHGHRERAVVHESGPGPELAAPGERAVVGEGRAALTNGRQLAGVRIVEVCLGADGSGQVLAEPLLPRSFVAGPENDTERGHPGEPGSAGGGGGRRHDDRPIPAEGEVGVGDPSVGPVEAGVCRGPADRVEAERIERRNRQRVGSCLDGEEQPSFRLDRRQHPVAGRLDPVDEVDPVAEQPRESGEAFATGAEETGEGEAGKPGPRHADDPEAAAPEPEHGCHPGEEPFRRRHEVAPTPDAFEPVHDLAGLGGEPVPELGAGGAEVEVGRPHLLGPEHRGGIFPPGGGVDADPSQRTRATDPDQPLGGAHLHHPGRGSRVRQSTDDLVPHHETRR